MGEPNIAELAVAAWRLERWLDNLNAERKMAAKKSLREIKKYLDASNIEIVDPLGWKFDPGLAVEVMNNEADDVKEENLLIIQTNSPIVKRSGAVIQHGKVILGQDIKEQKANNEIRTEPSQTPIDKADTGNTALQKESGEHNAVPVATVEGKKDVPDLSDKELERLKRKNISSYYKMSAVDRGLFQIHGKKKKG